VPSLVPLWDLPGDAVEESSEPFFVERENHGNVSGAKCCLKSRRFIDPSDDCVAIRGPDPVRVDAGVEARTGRLVGSVPNFSLPFSSVIVIDSGSSLVKAAAVGLSASVAAKALAPILIVILLPMDVPPCVSCSARWNGPAKASASVNTSDTAEAQCTIVASDKHAYCTV